jgi:hypothetical protein
MLLIFQKARRVVAWLGNELRWSYLAFQLLREVEHLFKLDHTLVCLDRLQIARRALQEIYARPWFRRTWVRQEVYAANELIVQCGSLQASFDLFVNWNSHRPTLDKDLHIRSVKVPPWNEAFMRNVEILAEKGCSAGVTGSDILLNSLDLGISFETTDDRDRVYGILGMIGSRIASAHPISRGDDLDLVRLYDGSFRTIKVFGESPNAGSDMDLTKFPIDYAKTVSEVFQDVTKFLIRRRSDLNALCKYEVQHTRAADIPSWSIDWREQVVTSALGHHALVAGYDDRQGFSDDSLLVKRLLDPARLDVDLAEVGKLACRGYRLGTLEEFPLNTYGTINCRYLGNVRIEERGEGGTWLQLRLKDFLRSGRSGLASITLDAAIIAANEALMKTGRKRSLRNTQFNAQGHAVVPHISAGQDMLVALHGCSAPVLLRPVAQDRYQFLGAAILLAVLPPISTDDLLLENFYLV